MKHPFEKSKDLYDAIDIIQKTHFDNKLKKEAYFIDNGRIYKYVKNDLYILVDIASSLPHWQRVNINN